MTPHKINGRGTLVVKRSFRGVSPIRRATGTNDPELAREIDIMYQALYRQARLDVLEDVAQGRLHPLVVYSQWRHGRELPRGDVLPDLSESWEAWEATVEGEEHRASIGTTRRALKIPTDATIDMLPELLARYTLRASDKVRSVNLARAHARAFLRDTVGKSSELYLRVSEMRPLKRKARERGTPHPMPVILGLVDKLNALEAGAGDMAWSMACSGMGNKEYWTDGFELKPDRVLVHGQKRKGRDREVPMWSGPIVEPVCWEGRFRALLRDASAGEVMIYDLRRSFARWCEEAGIISTNIDAYLGHGMKTMTKIYTWGQLPGQLAGDAAKLQAYRDAQLAGAL